MNTNFMEKSLINKCSEVLGISAKDVALMFEKNKETNSFIRRRIAFGIHNPEENIGFMLKGLLYRDMNDLSKLSNREVLFIKDKYGIAVEWASAMSAALVSERVEPLILGVTGENLLREFAKVLGISRKDAVKLIKINEHVKSFLKRENSLNILDKRNCLSVILQNTLNRDKNDFSPIRDMEIMSIYNKYGIIIGTLKSLNYKSVKQ